MKPHPLSDTIAAAATPPGEGALAVVRVSGPRAAQICAGLLRGTGGKAPDLQHRRALTAHIFDADRKIDRVVAVFFKAPNSYTGDDTVELACHGSPYIISSLMQLLAREGARPAGPGEFTCRAFLNGKLDLAQAEGVADLIASSGEAAHRAALSAAEGRLSAAYAGIRRGLVDALAELEARLDDADGEMPAPDTRAMTDALARAASELEKLAASYEAGRYIKEGVKTCIAGAPNAGKSSLLNALLGRERAIVSPLPGTTRDTIEESLNIAGLRFLLVDTAGLREHALDQTETQGMERTRRALSEADLILLVEDASAPCPAAGKEAETASATRKVPLLRISNKSDLPHRTVEGSLPVSCKTGQGIDSLRAAMASALAIGGGEKDGIIVTNARQFAALSEAARQTREAAVELEKGAQELCADRLYAALGELEQLIGATAPEEILDAVFSKFCVGK
ncbi:MAG: tRNA uridine-5-carboxymethylaminomethyl(34) synthesis GTPase MnmE [Elusimicrobia bacterium]|nr:tRNA uridine-5-carboxymethylaminomethyl(34) synthesis GTPase MnmE [Elusimicrobiota bacterium]